MVEVGSIHLLYLQERCGSSQLAQCGYLLIAAVPHTFTQTTISTWTTILLSHAGHSGYENHSTKSGCHALEHSMVCSIQDWALRRQRRAQSHATSNSAAQYSSEVLFPLFLNGKNILIIFTWMALQKRRTDRGLSGGTAVV
jgi:hypothetical protein